MPLELPACEICGEYVTGQSKAIGGGTVRLCVNHLNLFHEYIIEAGILPEVEYLDYRIRILAHKHNFIDTQNAILTKYTFLAKVYYGVRAWIRDQREELEKEKRALTPIRKEDD